MLSSPLWPRSRGITFRGCWDQPSCWDILSRRGWLDGIRAPRRSGAGTQRRARHSPEIPTTRSRLSVGDGTVSRLNRAAEELEQAAAAATGAPQKLPGTTSVQIVEPALNVRDYLVWGPMSAAAIAGQITLLVFLVYFLLASGDLFKRKLVETRGPIAGETQNHGQGPGANQSEDRRLSAVSRHRQLDRRDCDRSRVLVDRNDEPGAVGTGCGRSQHRAHILVRCSS